MKHPFKLRRPRHTVFEDDTGEDEGPSHPALDYTPPPGLRAVRAFTLWGVLLAGVFGGYGLLWFGLAWSFRTTALDWVAAEQAIGRSVDHGEMVVGGFPFDLRLTVPRPRYGDGDTAIEAGRAIFTAKPWSPGRIRVAVGGELVLNITGQTGKKILSGSARQLESVFDFDGVWPSFLSADVRELSLVLENGATAVALKKGNFLFDKNGADGGYAIKLGLQGLTLPGPALLPFGVPLGREVALAEAEFAVKTAIPDIEPVTDALAGWRDQGGTVDVARLRVGYGPLNLQTSGTLSLDPALQPIGSFTAQVQGFFGLIDALREQGVVRGRDSVTAKIVLGAMARKAEADGRPTLNLAVTVHNRVFYAGPVPLWRFPKIAWPTPAPVEAPVEAPIEEAVPEAAEKESGT